MHCRPKNPYNIIHATNTRIGFPLHTQPSKCYPHSFYTEKLSENAQLMNDHSIYGKMLQRTTYT